MLEIQSTKNIIGAPKMKKKYFGSNTLERAIKKGSKNMLPKMKQRRLKSIILYKEQYRKVKYYSIGKNNNNEGQQTFFKHQ